MNTHMHTHSETYNSHTGHTSLDVHLQQFEGPLDLLLELARQQKLDLLEISIVELAEQYLAFIENWHNLRLTIAAEYLMMAAWLAFLKSRLLLPQEIREELEDDPETIAEQLAQRLKHLQLIHALSKQLWQKPLLNKHFYTRGNPTPISSETTEQYCDTLYELLTAYGEINYRSTDKTLHIKPTNLYSAEQLILPLTEKIKKCQQWTEINKLIPKNNTSPLHSRSALAATLVAGLELTRQGQAQMRQNKNFSTIYMKASENA